MDLFTPKVQPGRFHQNFANCIAHRNPYDEAVISSWADGFVDRDGKFVDEFQTTFNSCFWELYLHAVLKDIGCTIDFKHSTPDFVVTDPIPFVMEATVALNSKDGLPEWTPLDLKLRPKDLNEFNRVAMIRLLNSISEKSKKYLRSYQSQSHVAGKPFVLALTPFDQPFFYLQVQRAVEAVLYDYYVDEQEYIDDPSKFETIKAKQLGTVRKNSDVELPLGIFNDSSHSHISAVLFNSSATWSKVRALSDDPNPFMFFSAARSDPTTGEFFAFRGTKASYDETLYDGMRVYHNPHALHPLDWRVFQEPGAFQAIYESVKSQQWTCWMDRPPLVARNLITARMSPGSNVEAVTHKFAKYAQRGWQKLPVTGSLIDQIAAMQLEI